MNDSWKYENTSSLHGTWSVGYLQSVKTLRCKKMSAINYYNLLQNIFLDGIKVECYIYLPNLLTKEIFPTNNDTSSQTKVKHMVSPGTLRLFQSSKKGSFPSCCCTKLVHLVHRTVWKFHLQLAALI